MAANSPVRPIWDITKATWVNHGPNQRFAIYHPTASSGVNNDVVLDKETRLVWQRTPNTLKTSWDLAIFNAYVNPTANRKGWRLPTMEELLSLVDPERTNPTLPTGHPFIVQLDDFYWSSSLGIPVPPTYAWGYNFGNADTSGVLKTTDRYAWFVRGGYGD
jgi:Protein of unknown function (DUF1566)